MARNNKEKEADKASVETGPLESLGKKLDERPEVQAAEEAVRRAKEQLERAQKCYEDVCERASEGLKQLREKNLGDLVESTLGFVRKHPGPGVLMAALAGLFFGRLFRR